MVVVGWVVWQLVKAFLAAVTTKTLENAVHRAMGHGVPPDFSEEVLKNPPLVKQVRQDMVKANPELGSLDVAEQYALALATLHDIKEKTLQFREIKGRVREMLLPQIALLELDGEDVFVDPKTCAYLGALALAMRKDVKSKQGVNFQEIRELLEHVFQGAKYSIGIENAWALFTRDTDSINNLGALFGVASKEVASNEGEFLVVNMRERARQVERMFDPAERADPTQA